MMRYPVLITIALMLTATGLWAADYRSCVQGVWQNSMETTENGKTSSVKITTEFTRNGSILLMQPGYGVLRGNYTLEDNALKSLLAGEETVFTIISCTSNNLTLKSSNSDELMKLVRIAESKLLRYDGAMPIDACYKQLTGTWEDPREKRQVVKKGGKTVMQHGSTQFRKDGTMLVRPVDAEPLTGFYKVLGPEGAKSLKMAIDGSAASFVIVRCDGDSMTLKRSDGQITDYNRMK